MALIKGELEVVKSEGAELMLDRQDFLQEYKLIKRNYGDL